MKDSDFRQERLYFFQLPLPFPTFIQKQSVPPDPTPIDVDEPSASDSAQSSPKKVSFATDVKPSSANSSRPTSAIPEPGPNPDTPTILDGIIGQLEVYQSGAVKMRLENGIVLDVSLLLTRQHFVPLKPFSLGFSRNAILLPAACCLSG
jgi:DNA-directed RNA polymerase III subunit RPC4